MNLFGKKKEDDVDTNGLKEAATPAPLGAGGDTDIRQATPEAENTAQMAENTNNPNPFVNPFSNQQTSTTASPIGDNQNPAPTSNPFATETQLASPTGDAQNANPTPTPESQVATQPVPAAQLDATLEPKKPELDEAKIQEMIDETVEKIIEERWSSMVKNVEKIVKWKEDLEQEITMMKEDIVAIKKGFDDFEKKIVGKVNSYDTNLMDVNAEVRALEKVFQKVTPTLVNNVNELSSIAQKLGSSSNHRIEEDDFKVETRDPDSEVGEEMAEEKKKSLDDASAL